MRTDREVEDKLGEMRSYEKDADEDDIERQEWSRGWVEALEWVLRGRGERPALG
jgi:hypothetical protein